MSSRPRGPYRPGHYQAPQSPAHPTKPEHAKRDRYDWATFWVAVVGVMIVALSTVFTAYQALVTKQQLDAALNQQRAWVKLETAVSDELLIDKTGAQVWLDVRMTNVGTVPAVGVWAGAEAVVHAPLPDQAPEPPRNAFCAGGIYPSTGAVIFPGETITTRELVSVPRAELARTNLREVGFTVKMCAVYYDRGPQSERHTDRTIRLTKLWSVDDGALGFRTEGQRVKASEIRVSAQIGGNTAD